MNHKQVEAFRAVMQTGSTSRAADQLHTSQPAVSQLIAAFEHSTKLELFARVKGRLVPTPEAQILYAEVEKSYVGMERIAHRAAKLRAFDETKLVIGAMPTLGSGFLPSVIKAYHAKYPGVFISLQTRGSAMVKDMVASHECDIGLASNEINFQNVIAEQFYDIQAVCAIPPGHPFEKKNDIRLEDLHGVAYVASNPEEPSRIALEKLMAEAAVKPRIVAESPYAAGVGSLVMEGIGVAVVNPIAAAEFIPRGIIIRPFLAPVRFGCWFLRPNRPACAPEKAFTDMLYETWKATWGKLEFVSRITEHDIWESILCNKGLAIPSGHGRAAAQLLTGTTKRHFYTGAGSQLRQLADQRSPAGGSY